MIRSRSNEAAKPAPHNETKMQRRAVPIREPHSEIESLASEHRQLVFWLLKETRKSQAAITRRLLGLLVTAGFLLASLALIPANLHLGSMFASLLARWLFVLGEGLAAVFLAASLGLSLYGLAFAAQAGSTPSISAEKLPRQQVLNEAQADLARLRQEERKAGFAFRWSALLFLAALLPYLFVVILMVL